MRSMLFAATLALASLAGCSKSEDKPGSDKKEIDVPEMSVDEVDRDLAAKAVTAVDCNGDKTRQRFGTIPGAILLADEEAFGASELPADKTAKLVFYCSGPG